MATVPIKPGKTEVQLTALARANQVPPALLEVPGGLYPLMSAAFEVDEYRILAGWPVPVPECDITIECLVSAEGTVLSNRDEPLGLVTEADMRWVADVNYYDQTSFQWTPVQGDVTPWLTSVDHAPTLVTDYEYRVGDERFTSMTALNFDSNTDDYMWNNLDLIMGGTSGYTLIMVLSPNSIYGNDLAKPENALWAPETTDGSWVALTVRDRSVFMTTEERPAQKGVAIGNALEATAPVYLAMSVNRPQTTLYAATGPSNVLVRSLVAGAAPEPLSTRFRLGGSPFTSSATMDMALLDLSIYGNPLSRTDVVREITALSGVYGGDS